MNHVLSSFRPRLAGLRGFDHPDDPCERGLGAHRDGAASPVVLASTNERVLDLVPLDVLRQYAVDVPDDVGSLDDGPD